MATLTLIFEDGKVVTIYVERDDVAFFIDTVVKRHSKVKDVLIK